MNKHSFIQLSIFNRHRIETFNCFLFLIVVVTLYPFRLCKAATVDQFSFGLAALADGSGTLHSIYYKESPEEGGNLVSYEFISSAFFWNQGLSFVFETDTDHNPSSFWFNGFQNAEKGVSSIEGGTSVDAIFLEGFLKTLRIASGQTSDPGEITFKVEFDDLLIGCDLSELRFDPVAACWTAQCPNRRFWLTKRSAVVENFFGHGLMHYICKADDDTSQVIGCAMTNVNDPRIRSIATRPLRVPPSLLSEERPKPLKYVEITDEHRRLISDRPDAEPNWARDAWFDANTLIRKKSKSIEEQADVYAGLLKLGREINLELDDVFSDENVVILDPVARGQYLHRLSWRPKTTYSLPSIMDGLIQGIVNREMRFALFSNSASLGICSEIRMIHFLNNYLRGEGDVAYRAAIGAHWHLPVKKDEIEAVVELLKAALLPSVRSEAIDVLVLLGQIDKVPADRMAAWTDDNLFKAEPKLHRRKLAYLMKTKSGRDYLRAQMTNPAMSAETLEVVKAVITKHVDATKKLKRFDMISEDEVSDLEAAINSQLSVDS
jgi:hypothetical protein